MWLHATVTMCHSRTTNLKEECLRADILIVAVGKRHLVKGMSVIEINVHKISILNHPYNIWIY